MSEYNYTEYFENEVLRKRPYLKKEWCIQVIENPIKVERQEHNRFRFWGEIKELGGSVLMIRRLFIMPFLIGGSDHETKLLS